MSGRRGKRQTKAPQRVASPTAAVVEGSGPEATIRELRRAIGPAWGWRRPASGRAAHVGMPLEYQGTTSQVAGLYPFVAGSGSPSHGVPIGRHMMWGEVVAYDPFAWLSAGLVTNPGCFILGQPGIGKSALVKRLLRGMAGYGIRPIVLGDLKPDYTAIVEKMGGQVVRVGRGMDRINPLDTGPLGEAANRLTGSAKSQLLAESRGRRLNALLALLSLVRKGPIGNGEENLLGVVIDLLDEQPGRDQPTVPDVLQVLRNREGLDRQLAAADCATESELDYDTKSLKQTLNLLCSGSLKGVFDGPTSRPINLDAPGVSVDISRVSTAGDTLVAAALLACWGYGFSMIDGTAALAEQGIGVQRNFCVVMDEMWRALRGSPGLVEHADALTRVNRAKGVCDLRATHSLADLEALPTEEDRAKARGFVERAGVVILGALSHLELAKVSEVVALSRQERSLVAGWSAPQSWVSGEDHPGKGKYLVKSGSRVGIPVQLTYVGDERQLYNTDVRMPTAPPPR